MTLALLSTTKLPKFLGDEHPDEDALFAEDEVLIEALAARGVEARRVDMARLADGKLALMEAELIEPQLFFHDIPEAAGLVADAVLELPGAEEAA